MSNIFFISDTHFGHENACSVFKRADGSPLRDFASAAECDHVMWENWNNTVSPKDKVYHLGDITMSKKFLPILEQLNGTKILIRGNHDLESAATYLKYFKDVRGMHQFKGLIMSHIPIHTESLGRWGFNVHGHMHANNVTKRQDSFNPDSPRVKDDRYFCVSVEQINYTPISLDEVMKARPND